MTNRTLGNQTTQSQLSIKSLIIGLLIAAFLFAIVYFLVLKKLIHPQIQAHSNTQLQLKARTTAKNCIPTWHV
jgi:hypothetical protein